MSDPEYRSILESVEINNLGRSAFVPTVTTTTGVATSVLNPSESRLESVLLSAREPISVSENEEITVLGQRGVWVNKNEVLNWRGPIPINQYRINDDPNPEIVHKTLNQPIEYTQDIQVRYLRPPTPPAPGELVIRQEQSAVQLPPAPPQIIRQLAPRPSTPEPLIIREAPPEPPTPVPRKVVTIKGTVASDAPPRKVIIEKLPQLPAKPQSVIIERWLPYKEQKRKVIFQSAGQPVLNTQMLCRCNCKCKCVSCKQELHCSCCVREVQATIQGQIKNTIVQWSAPPANIKKDIKYLGVSRADPREYVSKYGSTLKRPNELPSFVVELENNNGYKKYVKEQGTPFELEGDVEALKYLDLDREGLGMYKHYLSGGQRERYSSSYSIGPITGSRTTEIHTNGTQPVFTSEHITRY